jgi:uncharacterized protein YjbJ (UPF0337 family)
MNKDRIEGKANKVIGAVEGGFGNISGDSGLEIKGNAKKMMGAVQDAFGSAEECVRDSYESVHARINEKPVESTLIALGVGFILGRFLKL